MELRLQPIRNPVTGHFFKGNSPWNKGRKARSYMSEEKFDTMIKNLELGRTGNPNLGGWNSKEVIAFKNGERIGIFPSAEEAGRKLNLWGRNIRKVCEGERKHTGGIKFYWVDDYKLYKHLL